MVVRKNDECEKDTRNIRMNYDCERDVLIGNWRKDLNRDCTLNKNMELMTAVQALSGEMKSRYGVCLRLVSSSAIEPYIALDESTLESRDIKVKVLEKIVYAIKTDTNPFTKEVWGNDHGHGLTRRVVCDIIEFERTGRGPAPRQPSRPRFRLSLDEIEQLNWMYKQALGACGTQEKRDAVAALYRKIRGVNESS